MTIDFIARAVALSASQRVATIDLFNNLGSRTIEAAVNTIVSGGYVSAGQGAATYVSDSLATPALATACPRFCKPSADGRYWRAQSHEGLVPVWAGGAIGWNTVAAIDYSVNHRTAIAEALVYKAQIGAVGLTFDKVHYSIWTPLRTGTDNNVNTDRTGVPFVLTEPTVFEAAPGGTAFHRRKHDGSDTAVYTGTQILPANAIANGETMPWRGGMFLLGGTSTAPSDYSLRSSLTLKGDWQLLGGLARSSYNGIPSSGSPPYYTLNSDGTGWDVTDKAIWCEQDRYTGDVIFDGNIKIDGFRGELLYNGGAGAGSIYQFGRLELSNTDGDGFNPAPSWSARGAGGELVMENVFIHHAYQALEGVTGWHGHIKRLRIEDCTKANGLQAGTWTGSSTEGASEPTFTIDSAHIERSAVFVMFRRNVVHDVTCIDTYAAVGASNADAYNVTIGKLTVLADRLGTMDGLVITSSSSTVGTMGTHSVRVGHLHVGQTPYAIANSLKIQDPVTWANSLGDNVFVDLVTGVASKAPFSRSTGSVTNFHCGFGTIRLNYAQIGNTNQNVETTPALAGYAPVMSVTTTTANGQLPMTLANMYGFLPKGARCTVQYNTNNGAVLTVGSTNVQCAQRILMRASRFATFEWNGSNWTPVDVVTDRFLSGSASITWASVAAGAISAEQTITVNGVLLSGNYYTRVEALTTQSGWQAGLWLKARISANNTIAVSVKNDTAGALTPPVGNVICTAEFVS